MHECVSGHAHLMRPRAASSCRKMSAFQESKMGTNTGTGSTKSGPSAQNTDQTQSNPGQQAGQQAGQRQNQDEQLRQGDRDRKGTGADAEAGDDQPKPRQ
jgi:hypothetical protein